MNAATSEQTIARVYGVSRTGRSEQLCSNVTCVVPLSGKPSSELIGIMESEGDSPSISVFSPRLG